MSHHDRARRHMNLEHAIADAIAGITRLRTVRVNQEARARIADKKEAIEKAKFEEEVLAEMARIESSM